MEVGVSVCWYIRLINTVPKWSGSRLIETVLGLMSGEISDSECLDPGLFCR